MTGKSTTKITELCAPDILQTETITYFLSPKEAETFPDLMERSGKVLDYLSKEHASGSILLVSHGDIGKMIYASYYNLDWKDVLVSFHFGNADILLLSKDSPAGSPHIFKQTQFNH